MQRFIQAAYLLAFGTMAATHGNADLDTLTERRNAIVCIHAEVPGGVEGVRVISPTVREVNTNAFLARIQALQAILEKGPAYVVQGRLGGLLIAGSASSKIARYLELRDGDILVAINGHRPHNARQAFQVLRKARAQSSLHIRFLRGGQIKAISFVKVGPELDGCLPFTYSTFQDWVTLGRPACWCARYQCDGDTDGQASAFPFKYRVSIRDLWVLTDNWKKTIDDPTLDPCADIDHKAEGPEQYRVFNTDLAILLSNWKKSDAELPGRCPRPE